jgi:hypothetical protein
MFGSNGLDPQLGQVAKYLENWYNRFETGVARGKLGLGL